jgi:hypothetical protein
MYPDQIVSGFEVKSVCKSKVRGRSPTAGNRQSEEVPTRNLAPNNGSEEFNGSAEKIIVWLLPAG